MTESTEDANAKGISKYLVVKCLRISQKMLNDWIAKEPEILGQHSEQQKGTVGRAASLPQMGDYLHQRFLELRA